MTVEAMHELSIAMSIIRIAEEELERRGGRRIAAVHLRLGPLAGVVEDALLSSFEIATTGSPLEPTRLVIESVPIVIYCETCERESNVESIQHLCCSHCGTPTADVRGGRELEVTALEIVE